MIMRVCLGIVAFGIAAFAQSQEEEQVFLAGSPALSPNGKTLAFSWKGDIWDVPVKGGQARQLTRHPASDGEPAYSPDGKEIAFVSDRHGSRQVYVMPADGGIPERLTWHTAGYALHEWYPDGKSILTSGNRDHFWRDSQRFFTIARGEREKDRLLFDAYGDNGTLSPDGDRLLFTREGITSWRKGYRGSRASQIWMYEFENKTFTKLLDDAGGCRSPMWKDNGRGFYYIGAQSGSFNLWEYDLKSKKQTQLTRFEDDSVIDSCISRDGSMIVFRHLFDFYRLRPGRDKNPVKIEILSGVDAEQRRQERRVLDNSRQAAFTDDGLEIAFVAGGDLWVMDTVLREPKRITNTPEEEGDPVFSPDGEAVYFVGNVGEQTDLMRAHRGNPKMYWWQNDSFKIDRLTTDTEIERDLTFSPDGKKIAYIRGRGDLWIADANGSGPVRLVESFHAPDYDWSPDGKWIVYSKADNDFNEDVWIVPVDGSKEPVNISRHPDNEDGPRWSPDGKIIAFTGRRQDAESDIYYVWLSREDDELSKRDRSIEEALEKMNKARKKKDKPEPKKDDGATSEPAGTKTEDKPTTPARESEKPKDEAEKKNGEKKEEEKKLPEVKIDFDRIHERLKRISIPDARESDLFWSHDSKKLAFSATIKGKGGTWTVEFPDKLEPKLLSEKTGGGARWLKEGNQIVWVSDGKPGKISADGKAETYSFSAQQTLDREAHYRAGFVEAWRAMRDNYYDERLNNRDWDAVRKKYEEKAAQSPDGETFGRIVSLMLGELNGSHLGFYASRDVWSPKDQWQIETPHLGLRFDPSFAGPGLKIRDILPEGPAGKKKSGIKPGEVVLRIDGTSVTASTDLTAVLNGRMDRDIHLDVQRGDGKTSDVTIRPISFSAARRLLYKKWLEDNRAVVDRLSDGTLGYVHIPGMNWTSFLEFEREIYAEGFGKKGLLVDVRNNGGGSTTDYLLTVLCQPAHAITVPRGGGVGYPQDRRVYATWQKPITVLCNQNSVSNAEIFSHAIKYLERGQLVGVPTLGGVISTGSRRIMDLGTLRMPFRGWFLLGSGEDMELNAAVPDHILWPKPGELPAGKDVQLEKAIEILLQDVKTAKQPPQPKYRQDKTSR